MGSETWYGRDRTGLEFADDSHIGQADGRTLIFLRRNSRAIALGPGKPLSLLISEIIWSRLGHCQSGRFSRQSSRRSPISLARRISPGMWGLVGSTASGSGAAPDSLGAADPFSEVCGLSWQHQASPYHADQKRYSSGNLSGVGCFDTRGPSALLLAALFCGLYIQDGGTVTFGKSTLAKTTICCLRADHQPDGGPKAVASEKS